MYCCIVFAVVDYYTVPADKHGTCSYTILYVLNCSLVIISLNVADDFIDRIGIW